MTDKRFVRTIIEVVFHLAFFGMLLPFLISEGSSVSVLLGSALFIALNEKIEATQRAQQRQNEVAEATAAGLKEVATAEAKADENSQGR